MELESFEYYSRTRGHLLAKDIEGFLMQESI